MHDYGHLSAISEMYTQELRGTEGTKAFLFRHAVSNEGFVTVSSHQEGQTGRSRRG